MWSSWWPSWWPVALAILNPARWRTTTTVAALTAPHGKRESKHTRHSTGCHYTAKSAGAQERGVQVRSCPQGAGALLRLEAVFILDAARLVPTNSIVMRAPASKRSGYASTGNKPRKAFPSS